MGDLGTSSDPYVSIKYGEITNKTSSKSNCLTPEWNEDFVIPISSLDEPLVFQVFDSDTFGSDDSLGAVQFNLNNLQPQHQIVKLFKLYGGEFGGNLQAALSQHAAGAKQSASTQVAASAATGITGSVAAGGWMSSLISKASNFGKAQDEENKEEQLNIALGEQTTTANFLGAVDENFGVITVALYLFDSEEEAQHYQLRPHLEQGQLTVRLIGGRNLLATDFSNRPCSDPYVTLCAGGTRKESRALKNTIHPDWNELFAFDNLQKGDRLVISAWDNDRAGHDDSLGDAILDISDLPVGKEVFCLVRLVGGGGGENFQEIMGSLAPLTNDIASYSAQAAIGGSSGKAVGQVIQMLPDSEEENPNKGTIGLGLQLHRPLGDGEPSSTARAGPSSGLSYNVDQLPDFEAVGKPFLKLFS